MRSFFQNLIHDKILYRVSKWMWFGISLSFLIRIEEFFRIIYLNKASWRHLPYVIAGAVCDSLNWITVFSTLLLVLSFCYKKVALRLINILMILFFGGYFLIAVILSEYYIYQLFPLDSVINKASVPYFKWILSMTIDFSFVTVLPFIAFFTVFTGCIFIVKWIKVPKFSVSLFIVGVIASPLLFLDVKIGYGSVNDFYVYTNKLRYLAKSLYSDVEESNAYLSISEAELEKTVKSFHSVQQKNFCSDSFPLLHINNYTDVIGENFDGDSALKPNIVIILVESLSRSYSGVDAKLMSVTPFLDSLAEKSLYFKNFMSPAERTFGVTANVLASAPMGFEGFMAGPKKLPFHKSIISELKKNGYRAYYHEGHNNWGNFPEDHTSFFSSQNIDSITFGADSILYDPYRPWILDGLVLDGVNQQIANDSSSEPRIDVVLTATSHNPFKETPNVASYKKKVARMMKLKGVPKRTQSIIQSNILRFSSFVYVDEQLRRFFNQQKKLSRYKNTIYIIVGDHSEYSMNIDNPLQKFHVPCVVHSPLLNTYKKYPAVSTHHDIAPSLLSMLSNRYGLSVSDTVHWLGFSFDTASTFQCIRSFGIMSESRMFHEYIHHNFYNYDDFLMEILPGLESKMVNDDAHLQQLVELKKNYSITDRYVYGENKICPFRLSPFTDFYSSVLIDTSIVKDKTETAEYISIGSYIINNKLKNYKVEISIDVDRNYHTGGDILLVIGYKKGGVYNFLSEGKLIENDKYRTYSFRLNQTIPPFAKSGEEVALFIWNNNKIETGITLIRCKVSGRDLNKGL